MGMTGPSTAILSQLPAISWTMYYRGPTSARQTKNPRSRGRVSVRISRQGPFSTTERPVWQRQTEQGGVCRWLRRHAYHHRQACACRCHTAARIFSQTLARRVCQDFRAAFPCRRRPPRVAASKLVLSEAERIRAGLGDGSPRRGLSVRMRHSHSPSPKLRCTTL